MSAEYPHYERKDYEILCQILPITELDMSEGVPPEEQADVPVGGLARQELLHEAIDLDFSQPSRGRFPEASESDSVFFMNLHEESFRQLAAENAGRSVDSSLTEQDVWIIIGATCKAIAPTVFASILAKIVCAQEGIRAAEIQQFGEMLKKRPKTEDGALEAELRVLASQLHALPKEHQGQAQNAALLLVNELGWAEDKAGRGVLAVTQAAIHLG